MRRFVYYNAASVGASFLLDLYPATAAYSVRKLRTAYTGACIRVRRSSDNAEQDIGFVGVDLDTASLLSFVGAGNGFVTAWYDQSGSGFNANQTSSSNQPRIVNAGVVHFVNGKPALNWTNGLGQRLFHNFAALNAPISFFTVSKLSASSGINASTVFDSYNNSQHVLYHSGITENPLNTAVFTRGSQDINARSLEPSSNNQVLYNGITGTFTSVYNGDNLLVNAQLGGGQLSGISIGHLRGNPNPLSAVYDFSGEIQEIIIMNTNIGSNRTNVTSNINSYYGIY
jgi:hypothetical protein